MASPNTCKRLADAAREYMTWVEGRELSDLKTKEIQLYGLFSFALRHYNEA